MKQVVKKANDYCEILTMGDSFFTMLLYLEAKTKTLLLRRKAENGAKLELLQTMQSSTDKVRKEYDRLNSQIAQYEDERE